MTPLPTVVVGFGKHAAGDSDDLRTRLYYPYANHAQVLRSHRHFVWEAVIDPKPEARRRAHIHWGIPHVASSAEELLPAYQPECAVIVDPPSDPEDFLDNLPNLRAIVIEPPLGPTLAVARRLIEECARRGILVQVNLWRRADDLFRTLAAGELEKLVGPPQTVFGVYGRGLMRHGLHLVDFIRMLFGQPNRVWSLATFPLEEPEADPGDVSAAFSLRIGETLNVSVHPLDFRHYREQSLDVWGTRGRMMVVNEGLGIHIHESRENRAHENAREIHHESSWNLQATVGHALLRLYDNLAGSLMDARPLFASGESALATARILEGILESARRGGAPVKLA